MSKAKKLVDAGTVGDEPAYRETPVTVDAGGVCQNEEARTGSDKTVSNCVDSGVSKCLERKCRLVYERGWWCCWF